MAEENENMLPDEQAEQIAEEAPADEAMQDANLAARQEPESVAPEAEVPLDEAPMADASETVPPDERDESQSADQDTEVATRLGEGELIEDVPAAADEQAEDMPAAVEEQVALEAEVKAERPSKDKVEDAAARRSEDGIPDLSQVPQVDSEHGDGRAWYVVHCYSGYENKVRHNLEQRIESMGMKESIFDVVVPTEEEIEVKEGKRRTVERRVFPGYILVNMRMSEESWYVVRNTPGVTSFVGQGNTPLPLRPEEVSQIVKRMEAEAPRIKVTFKQGERVRIVDGPFNDFRGTVSEIDMERAKVRVMVNFFGRETPVELDFLQVEKA
jgi:transcriptional antiterminator NusG